MGKIDSEIVADCNLLVVVIVVTLFGSIDVHVR